MLLATATILLALQQLPRAQQRPNIILILADDHAAHAVSAYRPYLPYAFPLPATPNIDRLAREGMLFRNAFVTNSICGPARAAILTGQYGHLTGVMTNFDTLHATAVTFPGLLRRAGYQTAIVGKWHLVDHPAGFDHYELLHGQGTYYNPVLVSERDSVRFTGYSQDVIADHALAWLRTRDKRRPFYLQIALNARTITGHDTHIPRWRRCSVDARTPRREVFSRRGRRPPKKKTEPRVSSKLRFRGDLCRGGRLPIERDPAIP